MASRNVFGRRHATAAKALGCFQLELIDTNPTTTATTATKTWLVDTSYGAPPGLGFLGKNMLWVTEFGTDDFVCC